MLCDRFTEAFLSAYMSYQTDNYWIGLSDTQTQGTYRWISGVPVTYSNWIAAHTGKKDHSNTWSLQYIKENLLTEINHCKWFLKRPIENDSAVSVFKYYLDSDPACLTDIELFNHSILQNHNTGLCLQEMRWEPVLVWPTPTPRVCGRTWTVQSSTTLCVSTPGRATPPPRSPLPPPACPVPPPTAATSPTAIRYRWENLRSVHYWGRESFYYLAIFAWTKVNYLAECYSFFTIIMIKNPSETILSSANTAFSYKFDSILMAFTYREVLWDGYHDDPNGVLFTTCSDITCIKLFTGSNILLH